MRLILVLLAFSLIIMIHELGHFLFAKLFKVYVQEFSMFVGPKIWSKKIGETVYSLRTIPIGAYVKMEGEESESDREDSYGKKKVWQRLLIILGGPLANIASALLVIAIVFSLTAVDTTRIESVEDASPAYEAGLEPGDEIVRFDGRRIFTPADFSMDAYFNREKPVDVDIRRDGEEQRVNFKSKNAYVIGISLGNYESNVITSVPNEVQEMGIDLQSEDKIVKVFGENVENTFDISSRVIDSGEQDVEITVERMDGQVDVLIDRNLLATLGFEETNQTKILDVSDGSPAMKAGIEPGDIVLEVNGEVVSGFNDIVSILNQTGGEPVEILLIRDDERKTVSVTPRADEMNMYIGLQFARDDVGFVSAIQYAGFFVYSNIRNVGYTINLLFTRQASVSDMSGPIGIVAVMNAVVSQGIDFGEILFSLLEIFALISIAIGAFNLIPFPPLDGSKVAFLAFEAITKKAVPVKFEAVLSMVGMSLLLILMVFVTYADVGRLMSGFFSF